jgi:hypothetical protein
MHVGVGAGVSDVRRRLFDDVQRGIKVVIAILDAAVVTR